MLNWRYLTNNIEHTPKQNQTLNQLDIRKTAVLSAISVLSGLLLSASAPYERHIQSTTPPTPPGPAYGAVQNNPKLAGLSQVYPELLESTPTENAKQYVRALNNQTEEIIQQNPQIQELTKDIKTFLEQAQAASKIEDISLVPDGTYLLIKPEGKSKNIIEFHPNNSNQTQIVFDLQNYPQLPPHIDRSNSQVSLFDVKRDGSMMIVGISSKNNEDSKTFLILDADRKLIGHFEGKDLNFNSLYLHSFTLDKKTPEGNGHYLIEDIYLHPEPVLDNVSKSGEPDEIQYLRTTSAGKGFRKSTNFVKFKIELKEPKSSPDKRQKDSWHTMIELTNAFETDIAESQDFLTYYAQDDAHPHGYLKIVHKGNKPLQELTYTKSQAAFEIKGRAIQTVDFMLASKDNYLLVQSQNIAFSKLTLLDLNPLNEDHGAKPLEIKIPEGSIPNGSYEIMPSFATNKFIVKVKTYDKEPQFFSIETKDGKAIVTDINHKYESREPTNITTEQIQVDFLDSKKKFHFDNQDLKIPALLLQKSEQKNEDVKEVVLDVYGNFQKNYLAWADHYLPYEWFTKNGGVVMIGGVRAGMEYGYDWSKVSLDRHEVQEDVIALLIDITKRFPNAKIALSGGSGGGQTVLATMLYISKHPEYHYLLSKLKIVNANAAITNIFQPLAAFPTTMNFNLKKLFGDPQDPQQATKMKDASPLHSLLAQQDNPQFQDLIRSGQMPILWINGATVDETVNLSQSLQFTAQAQAAGLPIIAEFTIGGNHDQTKTSYAIDEQNLKTAMRYAVLEGTLAGKLMIESANRSK